MIDVCVRENDRVYFTDGNRTCPVLDRRVAPLALKHSAVKENGVAINTEDVT